MPLEPGNEFDRYRIEALIGEGGMGRIFRAFDPKLRRRVALKLLQLNRFTDGLDGVARVMREAQAAAALDHPGVVAIFDVSEAEGQPFIVMEFVDGCSLRTLVGVDSIPMSERLRWMTEVARILAAAHRVGLVHRDIKPENVMVRTDGTVKLLDFGIARQLENQEISGPNNIVALGNVAESSIIGTPCYMAPEQVQRRPLDARADQFSWGVMAYELFAGALPWQTAKEGIAFSVAVVAERQLPLPTDKLGLPKHVGLILERALEKSPMRRFESMDALVAALAGDAPGLSNFVPPRTSKKASVTVADTQEGMHTAVPAHRTRDTWKRLSFTPTRLSLIAVFLVTAVVATTTLFSRRNRSQIRLLELKAVLAGITTRPFELPVEPLHPNAPAVAAYDNGVRRFQQAALASAIESYQTAIEYEPQYAAAHLRLAIARLIDGPHPAGAESFLEAKRLRRGLDHHDRTLLDAFAPSFERDPPGLADTIRKLADLEKRFSKDSELLLMRPMVLTLAGLDDDGAAAFRAYIEQFSNSATPWLALAYIHGRRDELELARQALEKCLEIEPGAIDCLWFEAKLDAYAGHCKEMESRVLQWKQLEPDSRGAIKMQIQAMIAQKRDDLMVDAALEKSVREISIGDATRIKYRFRATRAILDGKFDEANRILSALPRETRLQNEDYLWLNELHVGLLEEMSDKPRVVAIATDMLLRKKSLPGMGDVHVEGIADDPTMVFHGVLFANGSIDRATFERDRASWMNTWRIRGVTRSDRDLWTRAYAGPARTPEAAREALEVLEPLGAPPRFLVDHLFVVDTARVYVLAGHFQKAVKLLEEACASCLGPLEPLRFVQGYALLGQAHEGMGNNEAACRAYRNVLQRWGTARPTSVTAEHIRARIKALGCKGRP